MVLRCCRLRLYLRMCQIGSCAWIGLAWKRSDGCRPFPFPVLPFFDPSLQALSFSSLYHSYVGFSPTLGCVPTVQGPSIIWWSGTLFLFVTKTTKQHSTFWTFTASSCLPSSNSHVNIVQHGTLRTPSA